MKNRIIATESFSSKGRHFFLDFMLAKNDTNYISITRSDEQQDGSYVRNRVNIFQEEFEFMISAFASLFRSAAYSGEHIHVKDLKKRKDGDTSIKSWPDELRPRERMVELDTEAMRDEELLAMLIGSGTPDESAVSLGRNILKDVGYDLSKLGSLEHAALCRFPGMGMAKSSSIIAAFELGRRAYGFFRSDVPPNISAGIGTIDNSLHRER
ncbi:hypothetical protein J7E50_25825 [Pedobacter sp. ISL-68]|uniref:UPF0758 domain-containing protein n=1 Tax=unclassified Pedobacter TaxID=2628915 RepID=UPI001BE59625|nr:MULTISPECIES: UPF0758 domain-containing protein [unclassified Pedobacter]MBT2564661.1 hypothetical protein [Pedobacter sp. ISL-64]MBT2593660.1 hypothetical protein [Pedobacter sp. ISL-68]